MTLEYVKNDYLQQFKNADCKYIVLKMEDLIGSIETWEEWDALQDLLDKYNQYRESKGKGINKYFVANREDFPKIKSGEEYVNVLRYAHNNLL
jgi:hypothetical protein